MKRFEWSLLANRIEEAIEVEDPRASLNVDELKKILGGEWALDSEDHPLRQLREWIGRRQRLGLPPSVDDVSGLDRRSAR